MQVKSIAECSKGVHSAIFSTFIKLPFVIKIFVLSIFEWPGLTVFQFWLLHQNCSLLNYLTSPKLLRLTRSDHEVIKLFSCSNQLSIKFIMLINVKMPTIVGILTFVSMINTTSEILKARNFFIRQYFSFYEQLKFRAHLS